MTKAREYKYILSELKAIKQEISYIKSHMVDNDSIMTEDDFKELTNYRKEKKEGKLFSHHLLKKELGL